MKLRPPAFLMLGMVRLGARSGYAIKKAADTSTHYFWPTSLAQVYPELAHLQRAGLLTRREDPQGGRARHAYDLTEQGESALLAWLRSYRPKEALTQFQDEGLLRLFFADALPPEDQLTLVRLLRERIRSASAQMREEILPLAEELEQSGRRYPALVARLGADTYASIEQWLARLEVELEARPNHSANMHDWGAGAGLKGARARAESYRQRSGPQPPGEQPGLGGQPAGVEDHSWTVAEILVRRLADLRWPGLIHLRP